MIFLISPKEESKIPNKRCKKAKYHSWTFSFTPTGIGCCVGIECNRCGLKKDISDYDSW